MADLAITYDETVKSYDEPYEEETKTFPTCINEKKATCRTQNFYILLPFLLITTA